MLHYEYDHGVIMYSNIAHITRLHSNKDTKPSFPETYMKPTAYDGTPHSRI